MRPVKLQESKFIRVRPPSFALADIVLMGTLTVTEFWDRLCEDVVCVAAAIVVLSTTPPKGTKFVRSNIIVAMRWAHNPLEQSYEFPHETSPHPDVTVGQQNQQTIVHRIGVA